MNIIEARAIIKAINRRVKKEKFFLGGRKYGVDFITWSISYPCMAALYNEAGKIVMGKPGRYMPDFGRY